jgi:hypothetical protein
MGYSIIHYKNSQRLQVSHGSRATEIILCLIKILRLYPVTVEPTVKIKKNYIPRKNNIDDRSQKTNSLYHYNEDIQFHVQAPFFSHLQ